MIDFDIEGIEEVNTFIRDLEDFEKDKAVQGGIKNALRVIQRQAKKNLRERTKGHGKNPGLLARSIVVKLKRFKLGGLVGIRWYAHHAHLVNRGTKDRWAYLSGSSKAMKKKGIRGSYYRGRVKATKFWDDAPKGKEGEMYDKLLIGIERAVKRINRK